MKKSEKKVKNSEKSVKNDSEIFLNFPEANEVHAKFSFYAKNYVIKIKIKKKHLFF